MIYREYTIEDDGGHGYYRVLSPDRQPVGTCEGSYTAREIVDEHIAKVYAFYRRNCILSPLQARAAQRLTPAECDEILRR